MSILKRQYEEVQRTRAAARVKARSKSHVYSYVDDLPSTVAAVWSVLTEEVFFERWSGMDVFGDVFKGSEPESEDRVVIDEELSSKFPVLAEFMTATCVVNGKRRRTATLNIVYEDGQCKMGLRERDRDLSLWVSATSFTGALRELEEALTARPVRWRKVNADYSSRSRQSR